MLKIFRKAIGGGSGGNHNHNSSHSNNSSNHNSNGTAVSSSQANSLSNQSNVNYNHNHVATNRRDLKAVQQAAAVAAAAAAANAHSTSNNPENNNLSGSSLEISNSTPTTTTTTTINNSGVSVGASNTIPNGHFHRQHYHMNIIRSKSPPAPQPPTSSSSQQTIAANSNSNLTQLQHSNNSSNLSLSNNPSNSNLKIQQHQQQQQIQHQYQIQQQQNAAVVTAATAAAEYYEQQLKLTQHKHLELDSQFRANLEQLKELKDTVNNLNEMNRKLYEENHQYKDRNIEQRQQIEHYHVLFQENQQKNEQSLNVLRKERDEAYQHESDLKRRMQQAIEAKQQEHFVSISNLNSKIDELKVIESNLNDELTKVKNELQQEKNKSELLEKKNKLLEKDVALLKESWNLEKSELKMKITNLEQLMDSIRNQNLSEKQKLENLGLHERNDLKNQLNNLESKLEEVIKEKAQISCKYGQVVDTNRELNLFIQNKEASLDKNLEEAKSKLDYYYKKCSNLEKDLADVQENHGRETDEWKKFQADLQTAVRVANDFMTEAEEKMNKMKEENVKTIENQNKLNDEIEKLKKKLLFYENNITPVKVNTSTSSLNSLSTHQNSNLKSNKENHQNNSNISNSSSSLVRNLIENIESTSTSSNNTTNIVLTSITNDSSTHNKPSTAPPPPPPLPPKNVSLKYASTINNSHFSQSTDTDDAKIISSRVRSNSTNNEASLSSPSSGKANSSKTFVEYLVLNPSKNISTQNQAKQQQQQQHHSSSATVTTQMTDSNGYNYSIYSTLPFSANKNEIKEEQQQQQQQQNSPPSLSNCNSDALANLVKKYGVSKRNALMKWCQDRLGMYKGIEIKNFSSSWNDGLAFCALMHSFMPSKIDYDALRIENNPRKNFQIAFKSAQSVGIQQTLNIHELLNHERPDWNAVMNYVTQIYKHFQTTTESPPTCKSNGTCTKQFSSTSKCSRSSSSSPTVLRNTIQALPLSMSTSSNSSNSSSSSSNHSNPSSAFTSASSSSSSISKTIC